VVARTKAERLLVIGRGARGLNDDIEAKLRAEFAGHVAVDFDPRLGISRLVKPGAPVVVAGGDGTVEQVVRLLADLEHPLGIIPLGTFNNFARALGLPTDVDGAVEAVKTGRPRAITLGRVNKHVFLEACAIGLFGEAIVLGDKAKDLEFGEMVRKIPDVVAARPFDYELSGDLAGKGTAMSLVFSNTASIGLQLGVSDATPVDPFLELAADAGQSVTDIVGRALASAMMDKHDDAGSGRLFRFRKLRVRTSPRVRAYADNQLAGRTPCIVAAEVSALRVIMPAGGGHN
jgi:diacylglycerol kinase family enzyme